MSLQILAGDGCAWKMVAIEDSVAQGYSPKIFVKILHSAGFHVLVMVALMANGMIAASVHFKHDGRPREHFYYKYYYIEMGFTGFFALEALYKIWCLGFKGYIRRSVHKFELLLVVGTTIHLIPKIYMSAMTFFQVSYFPSLSLHHALAPSLSFHMSFSLCFCSIFPLVSLSLTYLPYPFLSDALFLLCFSLSLTYLHSVSTFLTLSFALFISYSLPPPPSLDHSLFLALFPSVSLTLPHFLHGGVYHLSTYSLSPSLPCTPSPPLSPLLL